MKTVILVMACLLLACSADQSYKPSEANLQMREWFQDARFGMFIHWGVYSVLENGEWVMNNTKMSSKDYEKLPSQFNPIKYDPAEWVQIAKNAGMKYITITSKHHDGFAMYDSEVSDYDIVDSTPYKKDVLKMLAEECKKQGIKLFFYHSHLDWHHTDYYPRGRTGQHSVRPDTGNFNKYLEYMNEQISELCSGEYGELGGVWFDGWWDQRLKKPGDPPTKTQVDWQLKHTYDLIHKLQPQAIVGNNHHVTPFPGEDFQMFEKDLPGHNTTGFSTDAEIGALPLETCETMNKSWGYNKNDQNYKSTEQLITYIVRAAGYNANFLLNVGPKPDGTIQPEFVERLDSLGQWMNINGESIYGTRGGPFEPTEKYVTTYKDNKIYVHILDWDGRKSIRLPAVTDRKVKKAWILGHSLDADYSSVITRQAPWGFSITVPEDRQGKPHTIVVLEMEGDVSELKQPRIIDADPSKEIFLMGDAAQRFGALEYNPGPDWIQGWTDSSQSATWRVRLPESGDYEIAMTYACLPDAEDSELEINTGKSKVKHILKKTKSWAGESQSFEERVLDDKLKLSSGVNTISLRIKKNAGKSEVMKLYAMKLISSEAKEAKLSAKKRALKNRASTDWFVEAKYGVMFHWMPSTKPRRGPAKPFPDAVRDFDVEAFADMVKETGAGYVIFTAPHGNQWFPGPSKTHDRILPGRSCERDLIGDMADALDKREIKLIQYYHHGVGDTEWLKASGFLSKDKSQFFKNEAAILTEFGERYGKKTAGYWFDDRYPMQPFEELYQATKAGNPDRIVAWNSWILPTSTEFQDYYAGEMAQTLVLPDTGYFGKNGPADGLQPHGLVILEDSWHHGRPDTDIAPPRFKTEELISHVKKCIERKFVLTMNMGIYQDGTASPATLKQLKALRKAVRN